METLGGKSKSTSFVLVNFTLTPFSESKFLTVFETSRTTSVSLIPPIPIAPGSGPPCPGSITTSNLFRFTSVVSSNDNCFSSYQLNFDLL